MDPVARARAIAARLAASAIPQDTLGKRKSRWEDDADGSAGPKKHKKVYIPVDKYPDINFMGLLIGPRGSNQKRMEDESGAKILIRGKGSSKDPTGEPDEEEELHVLITGETDEAIAKAQSAVENILFNPQEAMRLKQEQLRKVAELNGTLNENYGRPDSASASNGPGHYGPGTGSGSDSNSTEMEVPRDLVGYIIGRGGDTIRELQTKSGARIQIVREEPGAPQTAYRSVSIAGTDDAVDTAKVLIQRLIDERMNGGRDFGSRDGDRPRYGGLNPDGSETMEFHVPNERVGLIIGRGGATIKNIQMRTGASINIPQTADPANPSMRLITITGTRDAKESAKVEILSIMNDDGGPRGGGNTIYMQVPNDRVGVVIGKRGETVKAMQDRYGVRIQIPTVADSTNPSVRTISIQGPPDAVHRAKEEIDAVILNGAGTQGTASYGSSQYGSSYYGSGYDQYQYGSGQYGYDQSQYDAYYQQYYQQAADCSTATASSSDAAAATTSVAADPASAPGTEGAAAAAPAGASATADPNDYWNGFYEYAAYYGIDAANEAWGVTGEAAKASAESYRQYQEQAAAAAAAGVAAVATDGTSSGADTTTSDSTTAPSKAEGPPGV